jgi:hypothetical protein
MTNLSLELYPTVKTWMDRNKPAATIKEAKRYLKTSEVLEQCNSIAFDEALTEKIVSEFLTINGYTIADIGGDIYAWFLK